MTFQVCKISEREREKSESCSIPNFPILFAGLCQVLKRFCHIATTKGQFLSYLLMRMLELRETSCSVDLGKSHLVHQLMLLLVMLYISNSDESEQCLCLLSINSRTERISAFISCL